MEIKWTRDSTGIITAKFLAEKSKPVADVVMGVAAFATLRGITAVARVNTVDAVALTLPTGQDLPSLLAGGAS